MRRWTSLLTVAAAAFVVTAAASSLAAREIDPAETRENGVYRSDYDVRLPLCHDPIVLEKITERFTEKEAKFWAAALEVVPPVKKPPPNRLPYVFEGVLFAPATPLKILAFEKINPVAWRPWGLDYIPRRYCSATATFSDHKKRRVNYSVREDLDLTIIKQTFGVEWCVVGLDRNWAYEPECRLARP